MGITYDQIDEFILNGTSGNSEIDEKIQEKKNRNMHKIEPISTFKGQKKYEKDCNNYSNEGGT